MQAVCDYYLHRIDECIMEKPFNWHKVYTNLVIFDDHLRTMGPLTVDCLELLASRCSFTQNELETEVYFRIEQLMQRLFYGLPSRINENCPMNVYIFDI